MVSHGTYLGAVSIVLELERRLRVRWDGASNTKCMSLNFLSNGSHGYFWGMGKQFCVLVPIPPPPMSHPKVTPRLGFGFRKNGTVRLYNPKPEAAVLEAQLGGVP